MNGASSTASKRGVSRPSRASLVPNLAPRPALFRASSVHALFSRLNQSKQLGRGGEQSCRARCRECIARGDQTRFDFCLFWTDADCQVRFGRDGFKVHRIGRRLYVVGSDAMARARRLYDGTQARSPPGQSSFAEERRYLQSHLGLRRVLRTRPDTQD